MKFNKKLLPMKGHYFLLNAGLVPIAPFVPVMAKGRGFSTVIVGVIFTVVPLLTLPLKPLFGGIADKFQCQKLMFVVMLLFQGFFYFAIQWVPPLPSAKLSCGNLTNLELCMDKSTNYSKLILPDEAICNVSCDSQPTFLANLSAKHSELVNNTNIKAYLNQGIVKNGNCISFYVSSIDINNLTLESPSCEKEYSSVCTVSCDDRLSRIWTGTVKDEDVVYHVEFWLLFICIATAATARAVVASTGDAICFNLLEDKPHRFSHQILWGSLGWGGFAVVSGYIIDTFSKGSANTDYSPAFYLSAILLLLDVFVSCKIEYKIQSTAPANMMKTLIKVMFKKHIIVFMLWCTVNGIYTAMIWNFLFWFLEDVAAANNFETSWIKTLEGLVLMFHCFIGEVPFFFFSGWILKKIGSVHSMTLVLFGFSLRFILYSFLSNPWWTLPIETLNGICFALFYATMATYARSFAPPGTDATIQNFVCALFDCFGTSIGSFIGGLMFKTIGGYSTFWYLGLSALILAIAHFILNLFMKVPDYKLPNDAEKQNTQTEDYEEPLKQDNC